ncbi:hypothetical protein SLS58_007241 [Diplodia intermedia]|uniref:Alpha-galactosidase n=1 Tax=Diplodia intermedia TaxID=856260 RepID=A0ABR3TKY3_9PEZI
MSPIRSMLLASCLDCTATPAPQPAPVFSGSQGYEEQDATPLQEIRNIGDINNNWNSVANIVASNAGITSYAAPEGFNDYDMLEVGKGELTEAEERAHFGLWAICKAPLLLGADLTKIINSSQAMIKNADVTRALSVSFADVPDLGAGTYSWTELYSGKAGSGDGVSWTFEVEHDMAIFKREIGIYDGLDFCNADKQLNGRSSDHDIGGDSWAVGPVRRTGLLRAHSMCELLYML